MSTRPVRLHRWDEIALEKVTEMISRKVVTGEREMIGQIYLKRGAIVPMHSHESEQLTYVLQGALKFLIHGEEITVREGEVLHIPSWVPHQAEALEDTFEIDLFSPIRQDWLDGTDNYFNDTPTPGPGVRRRRSRPSGRRTGRRDAFLPPSPTFPSDCRHQSLGQVGAAGTNASRRLAAASDAAQCTCFFHSLVQSPDGARTGRAAPAAFVDVELRARAAEAPLEPAVLDLVERAAASLQVEVAHEQAAEVRHVRHAVAGAANRRQERDRAEDHHRVAGRHREQEVQEHRAVREVHPVGEQQPVDGARRADDERLVQRVGDRAAAAATTRSVTSAAPMPVTK